MAGAPYFSTPLSANGGAGGQLTVPSTTSFVVGARVVVVARGLEPFEVKILSVNGPTTFTCVNVDDTPVNLSAYTISKGARVTQYAQRDINAFIPGTYVQRTGDTMTGPLTVQGLISVTTGGIKFPDNTIQSTAGGGGSGGGGSVLAAAPLVGDGSAGSPLSIPLASSTTTGALGAGDWQVFFDKENALTFEPPLSRTLDTVAVAPASAVAAGIVTTGAQTFAGNKTFIGEVKSNTGFRFPDNTVQTTAATGVTPGGASTQVQFNDAGVFAGDTSFVFNKTTKVLTVQSLVVSTSIGVNATTTAGGLANKTITIKGDGSTHFPIVELQRDVASATQDEVLGQVDWYNGSTRVAQIKGAGNGSTDSGELIFALKSAGGSLIEAGRLYSITSAGLTARFLKLGDDTASGLTSIMLGRRTTSVSVTDVPSIIEAHVDTGFGIGGPAVGLFTYGDTTGTNNFVGYKATGTQASPTATTSGHALAGFIGRGHDGTNFRKGTPGTATATFSGMWVYATQNYTSSALGAMLDFFTTPNNSVTSVRVMRIGENGNVGIGTYSGVTNPGSKLEVQGLVHSTTGGFKFPDGSIQTTAATGGGGGRARPIATISADYTILLADETLLVDAAAAQRTLTLPLAGACQGYRFTVKKVDSSSNLVVVTPQGGNQIDGQASAVQLSESMESLTFQSDGTAWWLL